MKRSQKVRIMANSDALCNAVIERGMTTREVAELTGISKARVIDLLHEDRPIRYVTAARLRKNFGADVIRLVNSAMA